MTKKKLQVLFIADPIETFNSEAETTFFLMEEICQRKHDCFIVEPKDLEVSQLGLSAQVSSVHVKKTGTKFSWEITKKVSKKLTEFSAIFLRKDPPVDLNFVDHLSFLEFLPKSVLLINSPSGIKNTGGEKLFALKFPSITPRTMVSANIEELKKFIATEKTAILKPLNSSGGRGIIKVKSESDSISSLLEIMTQEQKNYIIAQEFLPAAQQGDKRILLLDGHILAAFLRVPSPQDFRANLHSGGTYHKTTLTKRDLEIVATVVPTLKQQNLYFVGLDVIGDYCTEINVTSPMGIREANTLYQFNLQKDFIDWLEIKVRSLSSSI